ncbi:hypothetical protein [Coleofasciculus sp. G2-EDA-02]
MASLWVDFPVFVTRQCESISTLALVIGHWSLVFGDWGLGIGRSIRVEI